MVNPDSTYPAVIMPYKFNISQYGEAKRDELSFEIRNVSDSDFVIKLVDMPEGLFEVKLPKKVKAGKTEKGKLTLTGSGIEREFEKSITIELSDKALSRFTIPVKRQIRIPGLKAEAGHSKN